MKERGNAFLRFLDRFFGIPLIVLCSFFKKSGSLPLKIDRIGLLSIGGIGDVILLSAIIHDMRKTFPHAKIGLFLGSCNREIGPLIGGVSIHILSIPTPLKMVQILRKEEWDVWIDCNPWPRLNSLLTFLAKAKFKIGFQTKGQYRHGIYDFSTPHNSHVHELENLRSLILPLRVNHFSLPRLALPNPSLVSQKRQLILHCFSSGSQAHLKAWPIEHWLKLIQKLLQEQWTLTVTGNRSQMGFSHLFRAATENPRLHLRMGQLSLLETAQLLQDSFGLITIDTGIMHLSSALNCRTLCLHGPTAPERWGGIGNQVIALRPDLKYKSCLSLGFESTCTKNRCMELISVESVLNVIHRWETL
jgi:ADP-heptose:LPS heptosyltransferase